MFQRTYLSPLPKYFIALSLPNSGQLEKFLTKGLTHLSEQARDRILEIFWDFVVCVIVLMILEEYQFQFLARVFVLIACAIGVFIVFLLLESHGKVDSKISLLTVGGGIVAVLGMYLNRLPDFVPDDAETPEWVFQSPECGINLPVDYGDMRLLVGRGALFFHEFPFTAVFFFDLLNQGNPGVRESHVALEFELRGNKILVSASILDETGTEIAKIRRNKISDQYDRNDRPEGRDSYEDPHRLILLDQEGGFLLRLYFLNRQTIVIEDAQFMHPGYPTITISGEQFEVSYELTERRSGRSQFPDFCAWGGINILDSELRMRGFNN